MKLREIVVISFLLSLLSLVVHILPFNNSMINLKTDDYNTEKNWLSYDYLEYVVDIHANGDPTFAKRLLSTKLIQGVAENTSLDIAESFVLIQWILLVLCGIVLGLLSNQHFQNQRITRVNLLVFYLSFSVLFLFFEPIYSYDEPLQYLFIFLALLFFAQEKLLLFVLSFTLACVARESSLFLLPGLFFLQNGSFKIQVKTQWKTIFAMFLIVGGYFIFRFYQSEALGLNSTAEKQDFMARFIALKTNFGGFAPFQNTVISMLVVMLPFCYMLWWNYKFQKETWSKHRNHLVAFAVTMLINTPIVLLLTNAREVRLFYLPFLFLLPIAGAFMHANFLSFFKRERLLLALRNKKQLLILLGLTTINFVFSMLTFRFEYTTQKANFFNEYLFLLLNMVLMHWFLSRKNCLPSKN